MINILILVGLKNCKKGDFMGFWDNLGSAILRGGMDEYTYERYKKKEQF